MSDHELHHEPAEAAPAAIVKKRFRVSPIWLVPLVALGLVVYLAITSVRNRGIVITITFRTGDGLVAKQTEVRHKAVRLGTVEDVKLSDDLSRVEVKVRMDGDAKPLLTDHARFWVVRPRLSTGTISGLETLVSGSYIEVDPGPKGGRPTKDFKGLEEPPGVRSDEPGHVFVLKAERLGPLTTGAPVFYRDANVGEMLTYDLGGGTGPVTLRVFVRAPYDQLVHSTTRFWNASGLSASVGAGGLHVEMESLQSVIAGGIAFATPDGKSEGPPSPDNATFDLYENKARADAELYDVNIPYVTYFHSSFLGLTRGSEVRMFGVPIGTVTDTRLVLDRATGRMAARVAFALQPQRGFRPEDASFAAPEQMERAIREQGLRVVLESMSLVTGEKALSLQYVPGAKPGDVTREGDALVVPSQPGGFDNLSNVLADIAGRLSKIPFEQIGENLNHALGSLDKTVSGPEVQNALASIASTMNELQKLAHDIDSGAGPALQRLPEISERLLSAVQRANDVLGEGGYGASSDFKRNLSRVMDQVKDAARSIRLLADFLDRHPEALIRGRGDKK